MIVLGFGLALAIVLCVFGILLYCNNQTVMRYVQSTNHILLVHMNHLTQWNDYLLKHWDSALKTQSHEFMEIVKKTEIELVRAVGDAAAEVFKTTRGDATMHVEVKSKGDDPEATRHEPPPQQKEGA